MKKAVLIFIWFVLAMIIWTNCCKLVTAPDTFLVILGLALGALAFVLSVKTKCFTKKWGK